MTGEKTQVVVPNEFVRGDVLTAVQLNQIVNAIKQLGPHSSTPGQIFQKASPSKTFVWCVVRSVTPVDGKMVSVQLISGTEGSYALSPELLDALVMPGMKAGDYSCFVSNVDPQVEELKILPLASVNGAWYVWQLFKEVVVEPPSTAVLSDAG